MSGKYILDENGNPKVCNELLVWAEWFENANRTIKKTKIGEVEVSTVFLGIDHSFGGDIPILYETMIFGGKYDGEQRRYVTKEEALLGHDELIKLAKEA